VQTLCLHAIDKFFGVSVFGSLSWPSVSCLLMGLVQPAIGSWMSVASACGWPLSFPSTIGVSPIDGSVPLALADSIPLDKLSFPLQDHVCTAMTAFACAVQAARMVRAR
jgi:hypothetical protein